MKKIVYGFFLQFVLFSLCHGSGNAVVNDDSTAKTPDYLSVNVVIETEWGQPEKINNVNVFVICENIIPVKSEIFGEPNHCGIRILSGMSAKISDSVSGKLLVQIKGQQEPKQK